MTRAFDDVHYPPIARLMQAVQRKQRLRPMKQAYLAELLGVTQSSISR